MVTTSKANLSVLEPCLPKEERDTLRHFLGLLLEADEPEAMVASLRRLITSLLLLRGPPII